MQDFDPEVQTIVNIFQPEEMTRKIVDDSRALGFSSVNYDLIYGLPKQTLATFEKSIDKTILHRPDRIALYSFALVPWIKPAQRLFQESDLPMGQDKRNLYEMARLKFLAAGYIEIGMDHFALPNEALAIAMKVGDLHRNFMGYTEMRTDLLLGLGVSSISETPTAFHQNEKVLPKWENLIHEGKIPSFRGHKLSLEDQAQREKILRFMTQGKIELSPAEVSDAKVFLGPMIEDGLVILDHQLVLTDLGRPFLRNACAFFDARMRQAQKGAKVFSQSI